MRLLLFCLLLLCALVARADGFAYGKSFHRLQETDQTAVIHLAPNAVTVDMYIAIDGIPKGETITYILPFWHKPEGFTLEELDGARFRETIVKPAHEQLMLNNRMVKHGAAGQLAEPISLFSISLLGPVGILFSPLNMRAREKARQGLTASPSPLAPYHSVSTPNAAADLYLVSDRDDLQTLIAQAKLPARYADVLAKYHTSYFAVMRLTGLDKESAQASGKKGKNSSRTVSFPERGVRYHFRHPMPKGTAYTYTYPLGTGAAWSKPIILTEVYITCPDAYSLKVDAPLLGLKDDYGLLYRFARMAAEVDEITLQKRLKEYLDPDTQTLTANFLAKGSKAPFAWHAAYFYSNPATDISARLMARPVPWRLGVARLMQQVWFDYLLVAVCFLAAWLIALRWVLRPCWIKAGRPGSLVGHGVRYVLLSAFIGWVVGMLFVPLILLNAPSPEWLWIRFSGLFNLSEMTDSQLWLSGFALFAAAVLLYSLCKRFLKLSMVIGWYIKVKTAFFNWMNNQSNLKRQPPYLPRENHIRAWLAATVLYLLFSGGLFLLARWAEATV
ncbi:MAG: hypothetical protein ACYC7E_19900 [Armatimonadota bacterium]